MQQRIFEFLRGHFSVCRFYYTKQNAYQCNVHILYARRFFYFHFFIFLFHFPFLFLIALKKPKQASRTDGKCPDCMQLRIINKSISVDFTLLSKCQLNQTNKMKLKFKALPNHGLNYGFHVDFWCAGRNWNLIFNSWAAGCRLQFNELMILIRFHTQNKNVPKRTFKKCESGLFNIKSIHKRFIEIHVNRCPKYIYSFETGKKKRKWTHSVLLNK